MAELFEAVPVRVGVARLALWPRTEVFLSAAVVLWRPIICDVFMVFELGLML